MLAQIQVGCQIFDIDGSLIKKFPGLMCHFLENGSRIEILPEKISLIDHEDNIKWSDSGYFHHQLKVNDEGDKILVLSETIHNVLGCSTRFDSINIYNLKTGILIKVVDGYNLLSDIVKESDNPSIIIKSNYLKTKSNYQCESTHVNSLFQIQKNSLEKTNSLYRSGNWIVNFPWTGQVAILDKNLEKMLGKIKIDLPLIPAFHDVQMTEDGKLLIYVNNYFAISTHENSRTVIAELNLFKKMNNLKVINLKIDEKFFYQPMMGGVQYLTNNKKLISVYDHLNGYQVALMDAKWKTLKKFTPLPIMKNNYGHPFQEAKVIYLNQFLKNYVGQF